MIAYESSLASAIPRDVLDGALLGRELTKKNKG